MAITFSQSNPVLRAGDKLLITVYSSTAINSILSTDITRMTVSGTSNVTQTVVTITPVSCVGPAGLYIANTGGENATLTVNLYGIDTGLVSTETGIGSDDVGTLGQGLVGGIQKINRWAFWKPIRRSLSMLTESIVREKKFGLSATSFTVTADAYGMTFNGLSKWDYLNPRGGDSEMFILDDFAGYTPNALPPIKATTEYFWNRAENDPCPILQVAFKCNSKDKYQGGLTPSDYALIEVEVNDVLPYPEEQHLSVILHSVDVSPYMLVATASHALNQGLWTPTPSKSGLIDIKKFTMYEEISRYNDSSTGIPGRRHRMRLAINRLQGRAAGYVYYNDSYNVENEGEFNAGTDTTLYDKKNGLHNNNFINPPDGETIIDLYTYFLLSWMWEMYSDMTMRFAIGYPGNGGPFMNVVFTRGGLTNLSNFDMNTMESSYRGFVDVEFSAWILNSGAQLVIAGKTVSSGVNGPITINLENNAAFNIVLDTGSYDQFMKVELPKGIAWKSADDTVIFTEVYQPNASYTTSNKVYDSSKNYVGVLSSVASDFSSITYNGTPYARYYDGDVAALYAKHPNDSMGYGMYKDGGYAGRNHQLTFDVGENVLVHFRLRCTKADFPSTFDTIGEQKQFHVTMSYGSGTASPSPFSENNFQFLRT